MFLVVKNYLKKLVKSIFISALSVCIICSTQSMTASAAIPSLMPQVSYLPMWYYIENGVTNPSIHTFFYSITRTMSGKMYIEQYGLEAFTSKETLNLEQLLIDNPDLVAAGITDLDSVWNFLTTYDSVSPRIIHSTNVDYEFYCLLRNTCISLGIYQGQNNNLSVYDKVVIIDDYICKNYTYDFDYQIFDFQSMMLYSEGVCNAYAGLFDIMASAAGINAGLISSNDHIWNAVETEDGQWYQVDSTWNDCLNYKKYLMVKTHNDGITQDWWVIEDLY